MDFDRQARAVTEGIREAMPWILRLLEHAADRGAPEEAPAGVLEAAGLPADWRPGSPDARRQLRERARALARRRPRRSALRDNLDRLVAALGLDGADAGVFRFTVARGSLHVLDVAWQMAACCELPFFTPAGADALAAALGTSSRDIDRALHPGSALLSSGLVTPHFSGPIPLGLRWPALAWAVYEPHADAAALLAGVLGALPPPTLTVEDWPHLAADVDRAARLLRRALELRTRNVDVLIHGPPGTGRTELARLLVAAAGARGVEVRPDEAQLETLGECQVPLGRVGGVVAVVDRADLTLVCRPEVHDLLEDHAVPTVWVAGALEMVPPALLGRFDLVLGVESPPHGVRERIVDRHLPSAATTPEARAQLARDARVMPAQIVRAGRALALLSPETPAEGDEALRALLRPHQDRERAGATVSPDGDYDLDLPEASTDLGTLAAGLARNGRGNVLLFGPPGTGKTAFARVVAERAGRPLHVRTCSDVLDPYVGMTERNLAAAFAEAQATGAVLLIDEVDAMLRDRAGAVRGWEVSQVTELLVQIDRFEGILLCTTNRPEDVDPAARRRFAIHVRLAPPGPEARRRLVGRALAACQIPAGPGWEAVVDGLDGLTPGDVVAARKAYGLVGDGTAETFLRLLVEARPRAVRRLGFP